MLNRYTDNKQLPFIRPELFNNKSNRASNSLSGKVTEIIVTDDEANHFAMLMPLLAQLSQDNRWLVWVDPPVSLPKSLLLEAGIDLNKVILLKTDDKHSTYDLARKALKVGTCHAVISWSGYLSGDELCGLEEAALTGKSHGIVIRRRLLD
ncbi:cell division inhibitor SulA [Marinobacterium jannaschii]|uniref:cell division inhibitor SulA n=1 Tax=Marinobacterium jannaschii TaxID=64970 RepID=UPI00068653A0|nr:SulA-like leucine-rich domain-containing protein [Marinobacterium jannaschii]